MQTNFFAPRRLFLNFIATLFLIPMLAMPASAINKSDAESLINQLSADILKIINSGKAEKSMFRDFERMFGKYADVPAIARSSLGVARRSASASQMRAYQKAFAGYISRKYGKRFREFIGSTITVTKSQKLKRGYLVTSKVKFKVGAPFIVGWSVSDASGKDKMYNLYIEGISLLKLERDVIGQMLDRRGGDLNKLISALKTAG